MRCCICWRSRSLASPATNLAIRADSSQSICHSLDVTRLWSPIGLSSLIWVRFFPKQARPPLTPALPRCLEVYDPVVELLGFALVAAFDGDHSSVDDDLGRVFQMLAKLNGGGGDLVSAS